MTVPRRRADVLRDHSVLRSTRSSRSRRRPAAAASASCACPGPRPSRLRSGCSRATSRSSRGMRRSCASWTRRAARRRRGRSTRPSSRGSRRRIPTPAKTSSRSAGTAARSCCSGSSRLAIAAGARLAEPGEFTLRAYLNGRIDLAQAEAVADLVDAVTPLQARAAMDQLEGTLTVAIAADRRGALRSVRAARGVARFRRRGLSLRHARRQRRPSWRRIRGELDALARARRAGRVIREGRLVVIVGAPNAGKSSLFNALVGSARAIVTRASGDDARPADGAGRRRRASR